MTLIHGAGVRSAAFEDGHIFASVAREAAEAVEEFHVRPRRRRFGRARRRDSAGRRRRCRRLEFARAIDLSASVPRPP